MRASTAVANRASSRCEFGSDTAASVGSFLSDRAKGSPSIECGPTSVRISDTCLELMHPYETPCAADRSSTTPSPAPRNLSFGRSFRVDYGSDDLRHDDPCTDGIVMDIYSVTADAAALFYHSVRQEIFSRLKYRLNKIARRALIETFCFPIFQSMRFPRFCKTLSRSQSVARASPSGTRDVVFASGHQLDLARAARLYTLAGQEDESPSEPLLRTNG